MSQDLYIRIALEGPKKGEIIDSNIELSAVLAGHNLFASGADNVLYGNTKYRKFEDRAFCENGPVRQLRYIQVSR